MGISGRNIENSRLTCTRAVFSFKFDDKVDAKAMRQRSRNSRTSITVHHPRITFINMTRAVYPMPRWDNNEITLAKIAERALSALIVRGPKTALSERWALSSDDLTIHTDLHASEKKYTKKRREHDILCVAIASVVSQLVLKLVRS
jgi:hypothetical protein